MVVQFARGPINTWEASSDVPEDGQMVIGWLPDGTVECRIGDGVATWTGLPSVGAAGSILSARLDAQAIDAQNEGVVADGVTNCASALQDLLDEHDVVYLPPGVYAINGTLRLKTNQVLFGAGRERTIIRALLGMPNNLDLIMSANTRTDGIEHSIYAENITLADLTVDGRGHDRSIVIDNATHGCNIKFSTVRDSRILRVKTINGVLHNLDVCASQYQPSPAPGSDGDVNYQPLGPSQRVLISDVISIDSVRDDPLTCHNSSDLIFQRCTAMRILPLGSTDIHGLEVDEGSYRISVVDCQVYDHNAGFQIKGHTNTTPSWDVTLTRCRAFRCRTSFHIYHQNPATLPVGKTSWAKNVALIDCESIDPELKSVDPADPAIEAVSISGYRNVLIKNMVLRGGTGPFANDIVLDFGCDDVVIDGVYAIGVCPTDTGTGRALITAASAYGQGSNRLTVKNVVVESTMAIPVFRASNIATIVDLDGITAKGSTGPMVYLAEVKSTDQAVRLVNTSGYANLVQVGAGPFVGYVNSQILRGSGVAGWEKRLTANMDIAVIAFTDVPGGSVDIVVNGTHELFKVTFVIDVSNNTSSSAPYAIFSGEVQIAGASQAAQIVAAWPGALTGQRSCQSQSFLVGGLTAGTKTVKLRVSTTIVAHTFKVRAVHTAVMIHRVNASGLAIKAP